MKNILLIGDSIRMGYDKAVKKTLDGIANVYYPEENCRFAAYVLRYLHEYKELLNGEELDVLHWNAGLWDCLRLFEEEPHTPIEIYRYYIERICVHVKKLFPKAEVIFATSTSVLQDEMSPEFKRYNKEIEEYNRVAAEVVSKHGFAVNDLYSVAVSLPAEAHSDAVHYYTPIGTEAFANKVLLQLSDVLGLEKVPEYKEALYTDKPIGK